MLPPFPVRPHTQNADTYPLARPWLRSKCKPTQLLHTQSPLQELQLIAQYTCTCAEVLAKDPAQLLHTEQTCHIHLWSVLPLLMLTATHMRNASKCFLNPQLPEVLQVVVQHVLLHVSCEVGPLQHLQATQ